jgi:hypothetical protein
MWSENRNAVRPSLLRLEGREQPGSMFSTGLDLSVLAGAFGDYNVVDRVPALVGALTTTSKSLTEAATQNPVAAEPSFNVTGLAAQAAPADLADRSALRVPLASATLGGGGSGTFQRPIGGGPESSPVFYGGDFNGINGLANEFNTAVTDSRVYDDVRLRGLNSTISEIYSRNLIIAIGGFSSNTANWEIRKGVSLGNGGTVVASGTAAPATYTATGFSGFGLLEYEVKVVIPTITLGGGPIHINVSPIGNGPNCGCRSFQSTTSGANGFGNPIGNINTFWDSPFYGKVFADPAGAGGLTTGPTDFSGGLNKP